MTPGVREEIDNLLVVAYDKFLAQVEEKNRTAMKQCKEQKTAYTIRHQVEALGCVDQEWQNLVKGWVEELKKAVRGTDQEKEEMRASRNPLRSILEDVEAYISAQTAVRNPIIEEPVAETGAIEEEEEEEQEVIRRKGKGKMTVEEEDEEEPTPGTGEETIFVEELNSHVPVSLIPFLYDDEPGSQEELEEIRVAEAMEYAPETEEAMPVETGHISRGHHKKKNRLGQVMETVMMMMEMMKWRHQDLPNPPPQQ